MKNLFDSLKTGTLIGKYLTGKESANESEQLKDWIKQDNVNEKLFNTLKDEKQLANSIEEFEQFDKCIYYSLLFDKHYSQFIGNI